MSAWQDISTAPKDGSDILLYGPVGDEMRQKVAYWTTAHGGAWVLAVTLKGVMPHFQNPTHWQPLPDPPS